MPKDVVIISNLCIEGKLESTNGAFQQRRLITGGAGSTSAKAALQRTCEYGVRVRSPVPEWSAMQRRRA